jgi:tetratricopeptide (TPR) repeat protein
MKHLYWHRKRLTVLRPKIEELPDDHHFKPRCIFRLSRLLDSVGKRVEAKQLLTHTLKLWRERGDDLQVARTLRSLSHANWLLGLSKEGIRQAREALEVYERLNDVSGQSQSLRRLARLLHADNQLDAAEEVVSRAIDISSGKGKQHSVCQCYRVLGLICRSKGETETAINHYEAALGIASSFDWHEQQFWILYSLAELFHDQGRFDDAHTHIERAKSHVVDSVYLPGRAMALQARLWYEEHRLEEAKSEAFRAAGVFEKLGATDGMEDCRELLQEIENELATASHEFPTPIKSLFPARATK